MNIPMKYEDVVAKLEEAQTEIKCLKAVLNGMEFKQVDDMVLDGVDACLFLGQESARIIKGIQAERNGLREELESIKASVDGYDSPEHAAQVADEMGYQCKAIQQRLTVAEQRAGVLATKLGDAYEWGYGDGQNSPNGYSDKEDRDKCVADLLKPVEEPERCFHCNQPGVQCCTTAGVAK